MAKKRITDRIGSRNGVIKGFVIVCGPKTPLQRCPGALINELLPLAHGHWNGIRM
jgi:hypothetical protein